MRRSRLCFRFQPDRGFSGTDHSQVRDGPVQFEKDVEEDPFGLNKFLTEAKKAKRIQGELARGLGAVYISGTLKTFNDLWGLCDPLMSNCITRP